MVILGLAVISEARVTSIYSGKASNSISPHADSTCSHLPSKCWNRSPYLPLPLECIDVCAVGAVSSLQPVLSSCASFPSGNLPLQCIEIIQTLLRRQFPLR